MNDDTTPDPVDVILSTNHGAAYDYAACRMSARNLTLRLFHFEAEQYRASANRLVRDAKGDERRAMVLIGRAMSRTSAVTNPEALMDFARDLLDSQRQGNAELERLAGGASLSAIVERVADGFLGVTQASATPMPPMTPMPSQPASDDGADPYERIRRLEAALRDVLPYAEDRLEDLEADMDGAKEEDLDEAKGFFEKANDEIATAKAVLGE